MSRYTLEEICAALQYWQHELLWALNDQPLAANELPVTDPVAAPVWNEDPLQYGSHIYAPVPLHPSDQIPMLEQSTPMPYDEHWQAHVERPSAPSGFTPYQEYEGPLYHSNDDPQPTHTWGQQYGNVDGSMSQYGSNEAYVECPSAPSGYPHQEYDEPLHHSNVDPQPTQAWGQQYGHVDGSMSQYGSVDQIHQGHGAAIAVPDTADTATMSHMQQSTETRVSPDHEAALYPLQSDSQHQLPSAGPSSLNNEPLPPPSPSNCERPPSSTASPDVPPPKFVRPEPQSSSYSQIIFVDPQMDGTPVQVNRGRGKASATKV